MTYRAPVEDYNFLFDHVVSLDALRATERFEDATPDVTRAILTEAGKLCEEVLAPLQRNGDKQGAYLENGVVRTSPGFKDGYRAIAEGGWVGISADPEYGGMGLPMVPAQADQRRMDRHDEPDRASGRIGCGRADHQGGR